MRSIFSSLCTGVIMLLLLTLLTGGLYPLLVLGITQTVFHTQANGSLIIRDGKVIGSELLAQPFTQAKYFWGRPSATTPPYNAAASSGSNLNPGNPELLKAVKARVAALQKYDAKGKIPIDLVTASGSGLDPHISLAAAEYQVDRVARARGMKPEDVRKLVKRYTEGHRWDIFGPERVNVLLLNLALDKSSESRVQSSEK